MGAACITFFVFLLVMLSNHNGYTKDSHLLAGKW
jgi:hypothetical protein